MIGKSAAGRFEGTLNQALSSFSDTVGMVRKTWTQMGLPTQFAPTLDIEELDKRIADLQAVEQWLLANQTMLRGTIQGLEVQRNTIATIQSLSKSETGSKSGIAGVTGDIGTMALDALAKQFSLGGLNKETAQTPQAKTNMDQKSVSGGAPKRTPSKRANASKKSEPTKAADTSPLVNPNAWWDMLQGQFGQIAQAAMNSGSMAKSAIDPQSFGKAMTDAMGKTAGKIAKDIVKDSAVGVVKNVASSVAKTAVRSVTNRARGKSKTVAPKAVTRAITKAATKAKR